MLTTLSIYFYAISIKAVCWAVKLLWRLMHNRDDFLALDDEALLRLCRQETYRASGPGGQHRNSTDSAVRLSLLEGRIAASCADHRSQHRNRAEALKRLRLALALALRISVPPEKGAERWEGSWGLGQKDRRYAGFMAHLLDILALNDWAVGHAAKGLGLSTGRLVRVLARDAQLWNAVNQERAKLDLVNLRRP